MLQEKKGPLAALVLIAIFFLGFSLSIDLPALYNGFLFADQAVYFSMAQSIAYDGDLEWTTKDFLRYKQDFWAGPNGIFLKKIKTAAGEKIYFAKSFVYALFAAPFVRLFGSNGPLVFHSLLLFLLLLMGFSYFSIANSAGLSLLRILTFLFASIAGIYFLWIGPDFFDLFLVFTALFLWLYKIKRKETSFAPENTRGRFHNFLLSEKSDYLAAFIAGIAIYSKPPNVAILGPLFVWHLVEKKYLKLLALALFVALSLGLLFGTNYLLTSDWNYQGGERKSFYFEFPLEKKGVTFDTPKNVQPMTADGYLGRTLLPAKFVFYNLFYYFFGRFTGVTWYFFPAIIFLILFVLGKKSLDQWLIFLALAGEILIYIVLMPDNYGGGGGSLANRYFLNIYPLFLFLPGLKIKLNEMIVSWAMAAVFIGQMLISPFQASAFPSMHSKRLPFKLLPVEYTLINELPTNTNPWAFRQPWGRPLYDDRFLYFLDNNFNQKQPEENGWWTLGDRTAEIVLRTFFAVKEIVFHLQNNVRSSNEIKISLDGKTQKIILDSKQEGTLRFPVGDGFQVRISHQYRFKIRAAKGSIPYYENRSSEERRWLGVFFELEIVLR
jgi:hypothetical protein